MYEMCRPKCRALSRSDAQHAWPLLYKPIHAPTADLSWMRALLQDARRALGLFQHHDGITGNYARGRLTTRSNHVRMIGTAKDFVMRDYGAMMFKGDRALVSHCWQAKAASKFLELV